MEDSYQDKSVVTIADWMLTVFITALPLIGIVMLFVWAFGNHTNVNKANFAKASLILYAIGIAVSIFFFVVFGAAFLANMGEY